MTDYLTVLGRRNRMDGWQFAQCIDAIRILYCELLTTPVCQEVDWQYWRDSARELGTEHPSFAQQLTPDELSHIKARKGDGPLNQVRAAHHDLLVRFTTEIRRRGYAYRTEQSYEQWVCRYLLFCKSQLPAESAATETRAFLEYLAVRRNVSASTQNQALNALVFLYDQVLGNKLGELETFARAKRPRNLPVVLSRTEVLALLEQMQGTHKNARLAALRYGYAAVGGCASADSGY